MSTLVKGGTQADYSDWILPLFEKYDGMLSILVTNVPPRTFFERLGGTASTVSVNGLSSLSMLGPPRCVLVGLTPATGADGEALDGWSMVAEFGAMTMIAAAGLSAGGREVMGFYYNVGAAAFAWAIDGSKVIHYDLTQLEDPCSFAAALMTANTGVLLTPELEHATFEAIAVPVPGL